MTTIQDMSLRRDLPRQGKTTFFTCLYCYPDEGEIDMSSHSSTSRKELNRSLMRKVPSASSSLADPASGTAKDLHMSKRSIIGQSRMKVSIKKKKSATFNCRESVELPQRENVPALLPENDPPQAPRLAEKVRTSFVPHQTSTTEEANQLSTTNSMLNSEVTIRNSRPSVAFTYLKVPENVSQQPANSHSLTPRLVVSKDIQQTSRRPLRGETEFLNGIPKVQLRSIRFGASDKRISNLYQGEEEEEVNYPSLELIRLTDKSGSSSEAKLMLQKSPSKDGFGKGKLGFKVRLAVSIKESEEDEMKESIIIPRGKNEGFLTGLLNPIQESDEFGSAIGTTRLTKMRINI